MSDTLLILGAGVVGEAFARRARELWPDRPVRVTARSQSSVERLRQAGLDAHPLDLVSADDRELEGLLAGARWVLLSVAAGRGGDYRAVYAEGSGRVARALATAGTHLLYTSSTGVYEERAGGWVDEDAALARHDERTTSLVAAETNVRAVEGTVLRLSGIVAPERGPHRRVAALAGSERRDGEAWVNLAPLVTIIDALVAALEQDWRGVVNVSGPTPRRRREFYDPLLDRAGLEPVRWLPAPAGADLGRRIRVDRLRDALGVTPVDVDPGTLPLENG